MQENIKIILVALAVAVVGLAGGYYYGNSQGLTKGVEQGRQELLAEQKKEQEAALEEVREAANPFSQTEESANPFKDAYKNPFAQ